MITLLMCCQRTASKIISRNRVLTSAAGGRSAGRCARQDSTSVFSSGAQFPGIGLRYPYATLQHMYMKLSAAQRRPAVGVPTVAASTLHTAAALV